jgi:hypothetical protein
MVRSIPANIHAPMSFEIVAWSKIRKPHVPKFDQGFALDPRGKEVKIQGVSVLPTRKPKLMIRKPAVTQ